MYMSQDWLERQIQIIAVALAQILFNKGTLEYRIPDEDHLTDSDLLYKRLKDLIRRGRINEAEDELFRTLDPGDRTQLAVALDFYDSLNVLTDEELKAADFSRQEIDRGLHDVLDLFGISIPGL